MIGVIPKTGQIAAIEEFFELFKTPWELHDPARHYDVVIATGESAPDVEAALVIVSGSGTIELEGLGEPATDGGPAAHVVLSGRRVPIYGRLRTFDQVSSAAVLTDDGRAAGIISADSDGRRVIRLGYDLFEEVKSLLANGQPAACAEIPTLDLHIAMMREWILAAGLALVEIPPVPAGHGFTICLTHDIDFVGIRRHRLDHSTWGFLYRSTIGALRDVIRGRITPTRLIKMWRAVAALPFVLIGWAKDFWEPFEWYLQVERNLPATYYLIPFKRRPGDHMHGRHAALRATAYDVTDLGEWPARLTSAGCEIGVHGIDAWHAVDKATEELGRVTAATGARVSGIRMHWLKGDERTAGVLDRAGYDYDSTLGYNETVGFKCGTAQVFRPLGAHQLLELPMHIQDGALFFRDRLDLSEPEAWTRCGRVIEHTKSAGGVVTLLWHDRSHGPERFWGDFYARLVGDLRSTNGWFATAAGAVAWFRTRRAVRFEPAGRSSWPVYDGPAIEPPLVVRVHEPVGDRTSPKESRTIKTTELHWNGKTRIDWERSIAAAPPGGRIPAESYSLQ